ncbi:MAG: bifunctional DNA primase/polymerase [Deltaproteobacteria bacterium]|nr:bifunctional DNA primase/polymerase [Deltaproteobacteria bacterium]
MTDSAAECTDIPTHQQALVLLEENVPDCWVPGLTIICGPEPHTHGPEREPCTGNRGKRPLEPGFNVNAVERYKRFKRGEYHIPSARAAMAKHMAKGGNIGLVPPPGVVILDADTKATVDLLRTTLAAGTPFEKRGDNKAHYLARYDSADIDLKSKQLKWTTDGEEFALDLRIPGKSLAVIAPSRHKSGEDYQWFEPLPDDIDDVPWLPEDITNLLRTFHRPRTETRVNPEEMPGHDRLRAYVNRWCRYSKTQEAVFEKGVEYAGEIYKDRPERLAGVVAAGGELARLVSSAWDKWGSANPRERDRTDAGFVELFEATYPVLRWEFVVEAKSWRMWDGQTWRESHEEFLGTLVGGMEQRLFEDAARAVNDQDLRDQLALMSRALRQASKVKSIVACMRYMFSVSIGMFDMNPNLVTHPAGLGVPAVTVNLRTWATYEPRPSDRITKCVNAPYVVGIRSAEWDAFLDAALGNIETRRYFQKAFGLSMSGSVREHVFMFLFGIGGSGKSTILNAMANSMGELAAKCAMETFTGNQSTGSSPTPDIARLKGVRLAICSEIGEKARLGARMKDLTGGDTIVGRPLFGKVIEFKPQFTAWVGGNKEPQADFMDTGVWRRVRQIPMDNECKNPDGELPDRLEEEVAQAAILQWAYEGLRAYQREGLGSCPAVERATANYRARLDPIEDWWNECVHTGPGERTSVTETFTQYVAWMDEHFGRWTPGEVARPSKRMFVEQLKERGVLSVRGTGGKRVFEGLVLLDGSLSDSRSSVEELPNLPDEQE